MKKNILFASIIFFLGLFIGYYIKSDDITSINKNLISEESTEGKLIFNKLLLILSRKEEGLLLTFEKNILQENLFRLKIIDPIFYENFIDKIKTDNANKDLVINLGSPSQDPLNIIRFYDGENFKFIFDKTSDDFYICRIANEKGRILEAITINKMQLNRLKNKDNYKKCVDSYALSINE